MAGQHPGRGGRPGTTSGAFPQPEGMLPSWRSALVVVAHPDDETFGLGALIDGLTTSGTAVHVLCFTRGEASTLNENDSDLPAARAREFRQAGSALGVASVTLLDYPDGRLASIPPAELAAHVTRLADRHRPDGLLVLTTPVLPATLTTRLPRVLPCKRQALPGCRCWPGFCPTPSPAGCGRRPAGRSPASRRAASICASGWTGPRSAGLRSCMPARSRPPRCYGGGCSCKVTASTCAGCPGQQPEPDRPGGIRRPASLAGGRLYLRERRMMLIIFMLIRANRHSCQGMNVRRKIVQRVGRVT